MKKNKIKSKPLLFILLLLVVGTVGGTLTKFYTEKIIPNKFRTMTYDVKIKEKFNNTWGTKEVYISNDEKDSETPVVIRVNYTESWTKKENNKTYTLSNFYKFNDTVNNKIVYTDIVNKGWTTVFEKNFKEGSDGWYYYDKVLPAKQQIQILESINKIDGFNDDNYKNATYELDFSYEALEANEKVISSIWNKEVTIKDQEVNWKNL